MLILYQNWLCIEENVKKIMFMKYKIFLLLLFHILLVIYLLTRAMEMNDVLK